MNEQTYELECLSTPLAEPLAGKLIAWWEGIFQTSFAWLAGPLAGTEDQYTQSLVYLFRRSDRIMATCRLAHSGDDLRLGCLGEVATSGEFRGQGLARKLCQQAISDFDCRNGQALFLATVNPSPARRLYSDLGWQSVAGSNAMVRLRGAVTAEQFLDEYFRDGENKPVRVVCGSPAQRITMIPLILTPHDGIILDHNTAIISTRHAVQPSCEGLYGRYESLNTNSPAVWLAARRADGVVVGLASAKHVVGKTFCVDAFAHALYEGACLKTLYQQARYWAQQQQAQTIYTTCARADHRKEAVLRRLQIDDLADITYVDP